MGRNLTLTNKAAPAAVTTPAQLTDTEVQRIERYLKKSRSENTLAQYRSAWKGWASWCERNGHVALPADPATIVSYLTELADEGRALSTIRTARYGIAYAHRRAGHPDPCRDSDGVQEVLAGVANDTAGRGRGQADGLTPADVQAIMDASCTPRRIGRRTETAEQAEQRGAIDNAVTALLFMGALRRSEAAALRWGDVTRGSDGSGILIRVAKSKTDQAGEEVDYRYLKGRCAAAVWAIRPPAPDDNDLVLGGINGQTVARRLTAAARAAGIEGRITGHSGRVGLAVTLTKNGAATHDIMLAGGWDTSRMVARYSAAASAEQGAVARLL